jgi:predicted AAA+ superfamily ATPase
MGSFDQLQGYPALGASWETYIIQEVASILPPRYEMYFYRTQDGTEADLLLVKAGIPDTLLEIKYSSAPKITKSLRTAAHDLQTRRNVIVAPVDESYPLGPGFEVLRMQDLGGLF